MSMTMRQLDWCPVCRRAIYPENLGLIAAQVRLFGVERYAVCFCGQLMPRPWMYGYRKRWRARCRAEIQTLKGTT